MMIFDLINLTKIRKAVLYLFVILAAAWLQTMAFSRLPLLGANPFFVPALAVAIGMLEGGVWGGVLGLVAGAYCDMCLLSSTVLCTVLFACFGFFTGTLTEFFINRRFVSYLLLAVLALGLTAVLQAGSLWIFRGMDPKPLMTVAALQTAWSVPFAVPIYFIVKLIAGRTRDR